MRVFSLAAAVAALLVPAAPAMAGDPTMPLWQVQAGMHCTGYSVIQGTAISSFDVDVLEVAGGEATGGGAEILVQVSGAAVDPTGVGPGFSGSPIYCADGAGTMRVIGAIAQSVNEYGGKVALATPIDAILGTPVDVPGASATAAPAAGGASRVAAAPAVGGASRAAARAALARRKPSARMRWALAHARPIASPLTVSGLSGPIAQALEAAGQ